MHVYGDKGDTDLAFKVEGSSGSLFEVVDSFEGSLMQVNDMAGISLFDITNIGIKGTFYQYTYNQELWIDDVADSTYFFSIAGGGTGAGGSPYDEPFDHTTIMPVSGRIIKIMVSGINKNNNTWNENSNLQFYFYRNPDLDSLTETAVTNTAIVQGHTSGINTQTFKFTVPAVWSAGDIILFGVEEKTGTSYWQEKTAVIVYQIDERTLEL